MPELMTTAEVSELARTPEETLRYWRHIGKGPRSFKVGRRVLYRREDVRAWLDEQYAQSPDARHGRPVRAEAVVTLSATTPAPACGGTAGHHVCITCDVHFANNLQATRHEGAHPYHEFGWMCPEHGLEVAA